MAEANTTHDIQDIKKSLGQEVVPAVTGKPSRVLKDQRPKRPAKRVTAGGASLYEIAAAIKADPTMTVEAAIKQGQKEAKQQRNEMEGGAVRRATKNFIMSALGPGLGGWVTSLLDTKSQRQNRQLNEANRKFEEGSKIKADFLKGLLGQKLGGQLAKATTLTSTKASAFEKYQDLTAQLYPEQKTAQKMSFVRQPVKAAPTQSIKKVNPNKADAQKALMSLGYSKQEATERLKDAPDTGSTQELVKHGLNPNSVQLTTPQAHSEATKQLSEQDQAKEDTKVADEKAEKKENKEFKKEVKEELKKIEENTSKKGGWGWLLVALGAAIGALIYKFWDKIEAAYNKIKDFVSQYVIEPIMKVINAISDAIAPVVEWVKKHFMVESEAAKRSIEEGITGSSGRGLGETLSKKALLAQAKEADLKGNFKHGDLLRDRANQMNDTDVWNPSTRSVQHNAINQPKPAAVVPKAPEISPKQVSDVSQATQDAKKDNDQADIMGAFTGALTQASAPNSVDLQTAKDVKDIKSALPALAKQPGPSAAVIKTANDEGSVSSYLGGIFDHPATYGSR